MTIARQLCITGAVWLALLVLGQAALAAAPFPGEGGGSARTFLKGPYLQNLSAGGVTVCWQTDAPSNATVSYWMDGAPERSVSDNNLTTFHELRLAGLAAGTTYRYRAVSGDAPGAPSTFTTAPTGSAPFRFAVYGDCRTGHPNHANIIKGMRSQGPAFYLATGDLVETGSLDSDWQAFLGIISPYANDTPYWPCPGNHDLPPNLYKQYFSLPGNEMYYSFDYGGAHFISLDSTGDLSNGSAQLEWLEADLSASSASDWKFVFLHHPPYSSALGHGSSLALRALLDPLFARYRVSAVFAGHDHDYEHADPKNGVQYFVTGGGGAPLSPSGRSDFTVYSESAFHYLVVDVGEDANHSNLTAYRENGSVMETVHLSNVRRPPPPPSGLAITNSTQSAITVAWTPPAGPYLSGYNLSISDSVSFNRLAGAAPSVANYTFAGLPADRELVVSVTALYHDPLGTPPDYASAPAVTSGRTAPVPRHPPSILVIAPADGRRFLENQTVNCTAVVTDAGAGDVVSVGWRLDGALLASAGPNISFPAGTPGNHTLTARATDQNGDFGESSVVFNVSARPPPPGPPIVVAFGPPSGLVVAVLAASVLAGVMAAYLLHRRSRTKKGAI